MKIYAFKPCSFPNILNEEHLAYEYNMYTCFFMKMIYISNLHCKQSSLYYKNKHTENMPNNVCSKKLLNL